MNYYKDKIAVVTGAGSGMGRELAIILAKRHCNLILTDINGQALAKTKHLIDHYPIQCDLKEIDMGDKDQIKKFAEDVTHTWGKVHFLFNNAGVALTGSLKDQSIEDFEWLININFWGVIYASQFFLPLLIKSGEGHLINTSSVLGFVGLPRHAAYCTSKFGVRGYTETLAQEMAIEQLPVKVSCVHPGGIRTNIVNDGKVGSSEDRSKMIKAFEKSTYLDADQAAKIILKGVEKGKRKILVGPDAFWIDVLSRLLGRFYQPITQAIAKHRVY